MDRMFNEEDYLGIPPQESPESLATRIVLGESAPLLPEATSSIPSVDYTQMPVYGTGFKHPSGVSPEWWENFLRKREELRAEVRKRMGRQPVEKAPEIPSKSLAEIYERAKPKGVSTEGIDVTPQQVQDFLQRYGAGERWTTEEPPKGKGKKTTGKSTGGATTPAATPPPVISPQLESQKITPPTFPEIELTPRIDVGRELTGIINAIPEKLEDLGAGPRPRATIRGPETWLESLLMPLFYGPRAAEAGGLEGWIEKQRLIAERPWKEELEWRRKRYEDVQKLQLKSLELRMTQNQQVREDERKAYALMGERNPMLAGSVNYVKGLLSDLPPAAVNKLIKENVDPTTGQFKKGASLYITPEERWEYKKQAVAGILQQLGITDPKEQAMYMDSPDKYYDMIKERTGSIEKAILYEQSQPPTPERQARIKQLQDIAQAIKFQPQTHDHLEMGYMLKALEREEANLKQKAIDQYEINRKRMPEAEAHAQLQRDTATIESTFKGYTDLTYRRFTGKTLSAYHTPAKGEALKEYMSGMPEFGLYVKVFPTLFPDLTNKADITKTFEELKSMTYQAGNALTGPGSMSRSEYERDQLKNPIDQYRFRDLWNNMIRMIDRDTLIAATTMYGHADYIPFNRLQSAAIYLTENPGDIAGSRKIILGR